MRFFSRVRTAMERADLEYQRMDILTDEKNDRLQLLEAEAEERVAAKMIVGGYLNREFHRIKKATATPEKMQSHESKNRHMIAVREKTDYEELARIHTNLLEQPEREKIISEATKAYLFFTEEHNRLKSLGELQRDGWDMTDTVEHSNAFVLV